MEARRRRREKEVRHEGEGLKPRRKRMAGELVPEWREREGGRVSSPPVGGSDGHIRVMVAGRGRGFS